MDSAEGSAEAGAAGSGSATGRETSCPETRQRHCAAGRLLAGQASPSSATRVDEPGRRRALTSGSGRLARCCSVRRGRVVGRLGRSTGVSSGQCRSRHREGTPEAAWRATGPGLSTLAGSSLRERRMDLRRGCPLTLPPHSTAPLEDEAPGSESVIERVTLKFVDSEILVM